jgi:hypothetical protein
MNAPRNCGAGERIQQVVGASTLRRRPVHQIRGEARRSEESPSQEKSWIVASALDLLGLVQRAFSIEPPERDLGMDLEDGCGGGRIVPPA